MPSGHSMGAMMAATFWSLWIWQHGSGGVVSKGIRCGLLIAMALAVVISRTSVIENCHTPLQVIVGSLLGIMLGYGFYFVDLYCIGHK